jgi:L-lactate utilization protein LutB
MIRALGRLEEALLRAEAAGAAVTQAADERDTARDSLAQELAGLQARHDRLRATAGAAIDRLDTLIDPAEGETAHG